MFKIHRRTRSILAKEHLRKDGPDPESDLGDHMILGLTTPIVNWIAPTANAVTGATQAGAVEAVASVLAGTHDQR